MGGRFKKRTLNRKKTNLAVSMKKHKKKDKKAKVEETPAPAPTPEIQEDQVENDIVMEGDNGAKAEKSAPAVNESRLSRTEMPLKFDLQSRKVKKANKHSNVVGVAQMSKKKFNKLMRNKKRDERERERAANKMEA